MTLPNHVSRYLAEIGRKGGAAGTGRRKARTSDQARAAANVRWDAARARHRARAAVGKGK